MHLPLKWFHFRISFIHINTKVRPGRVRKSGSWGTVTTFHPFRRAIQTYCIRPLYKEYRFGICIASLNS